MIYIEGRKVRVLTGQRGKEDRAKAQTVRICTKDNRIGQYDYVLRLYSPHFTSEDELKSQNFQTIESCVIYLKKKYNAKEEKSPDKGEHTGKDKSPTRPIVKRTVSPSSWDKKIAKVVEETIDQFVCEFLEFPYLHRREHSIHCELYRLLYSRRILSGHHPMGKWFSQLVHKEWPEVSPRYEKFQRGTIDLCIISPEKLKNCSWKEFIEGKIVPSIGIEVGLDYNSKHLESDLDKLSNSSINFGYVIHLVRQNYSDDFEIVEKLILQAAPKVKTAYARLTGNKAFYKMINDNEIKEILIDRLQK